MSSIEDDIDSLIAADDDPRIVGWDCVTCGATNTVEVCQGDQCVTVCAECGSDEP